MLFSFSSRNRLTVCLAAIVVGAATILFIRSTPPLPVHLPNPNGYDDFVKAGSVGTILRKDFARLPDQELEKFVAANEERYQLISSGLNKESMVPLEWTDGFLANQRAALMATKSSAQALRAQALLHERQGRTNEAARGYAEIIRLGHHSLRRGLIIDLLATISIEAMGAIPLRNTIPFLESATCRELLETITKVDAQAEPFEDVLQRDRKWTQATRRLRDYWSIPMMLWHSRSLHPEKAALDKARQHYEGQRQRRQQVLAELAARAYDSSKGGLPRTLRTFPQPASGRFGGNSAAAPMRSTN